MSETTPRLGLPLLMAAQAQKHVTHNEALLRLDHVTQLSLVALAVTDPPAAAEEGQIWALGPAPGGDWAGQGGNLAVWFDGAWQFITPGTGWRAALGTAIHVFDGTDWVAPALPALDNLPGLGINASHDTTNRLAVSAPATLLNHQGEGHRLKLNKATAGDTASLLFQTGFSGRAEMGTAGNDDFSIKVSADGGVWRDALVAHRSTGALSAPNGLDAAILTRVGSPVYARSTILGTVSQSGGVPTGAVIQRGSNANGEFVRFADGTQICWLAPRTITLSVALGTLWRGVAPGLPYPASFVGTPTVVPARAAGGITSEMVSSWPGNPTGISTTQCDLRWIGVTHNADVAGCAATATGRWF